MYLSANRASISIQGSLAKYSSSYQSTLQKLSTGVKYSSIAEDAVGYSQGSKLKSQIGLNNKLVSDIGLGNDVLSIATSAEENVSMNLFSIKDLCLQAANGTYSDSDKDKIITEIKSKLETINMIASTTTFGDKTLLDGSCTTMPIQISTTANDSIDIAKSFTDVRTASLDVDFDPTATGATWTNADIYLYMDKIDLATSTLTKSEEILGTYSTRLDSATIKLNNMNLSLTELNSAYSDADIAKLSAEAVQEQILQQASVTILAQANQMAASVFDMLNPF